MILLEGLRREIDEKIESDEGIDIVMCYVVGMYATVLHADYTSNPIIGG
jgi:hypothetical protein